MNIRTTISRNNQTDRIETQIVTFEMEKTIEEKEEEEEGGARGKRVADAVFRSEWGKHDVNR